MKTILLVLPLLFGAVLHANDIQCKEDGNQLQLNQCAYEDFKKADKALNKAYSALRSKKKSNKTYLTNLKISQRLWIKFRDAELDLIFSCGEENKRICFGSMYPLLYNSEKANITQARTKVLQSYMTAEIF